MYVCPKENENDKNGTDTEDQDFFAFTQNRFMDLLHVM